jgi:porphobilinogen synthase
MLDHEALLAPPKRLRRLRTHPQLRTLISEHRLSVQDLVLPLFIKAGHNLKIPISALPGHYQWSVDRLPEMLELVGQAGIPAVMLFGIPSYKDAEGSSSWDPEGVVQQAIRVIKKQAPQILVIADVCFCEYTDHGHCGVVYQTPQGHWDVHNNNTFSLLANQAVSLAQAGADVLAPSGMIDGMVRTIRQALDQAQFDSLPILSYAVKYASAFYGPFREAAEGAPQFGDRKTYQMNPAHSQMALQEAEIDIQEGADMLMVKPAHTYLDIIYRVKQRFPYIPLGAYHVSGEFAMIKAAAARGWIDESTAMMESLLAIKRAGADFIITYFALDFVSLSKAK